MRRHNIRLLAKPVSCSRTASRPATDTREATYTLARTSYFADADLGFSKGANDFLHTENFVLVDAHKRIRGVYNGTLPLDIKRLIEDIRLLKSES